MPRILPFGAKAARFIFREAKDDAKLNILSGSIRSSKTWAANAKTVKLLLEGFWPGGTGLITGASKQTIKTNILNDIFDIVGEKRYRYNNQSGELRLLGRPFLVCGAKDEGSFRYIKGSTVGFWLADEMTLYPQSFFDMAMSRLSLPMSRAYGTTNPADPYHYLKEWMDDEQKKANGDVWSDHFTLDDNPNIDDHTKAQFKRMFSGVFFRRNILGEWCIAEGAVYRDVLTDDIWYDDVSRPLGLKSQNGYRERWVAVDVGTINPCVFLDIYDDGNTVWCEREMYYDSQSMMRQKTDSEYGDDMLRFVGTGDQRLWPGIIVDPSAASLKLEFRKRGFHVIDAVNDVMEGISLVSAMLNQKKLRIHRKNCPNTVREMLAYAWDTKRAELGKEQPIKAHDHGPDALRYHVKTRVSQWRLAA